MKMFRGLPQGWSIATTLGTNGSDGSTLKALGMYGNNPFRVNENVSWLPQGCRCAPTLGLN